VPTTTLPTQVLGESETRTVLPVTGAAATLLAAIGALLIVGGTILLVTARRRHAEA
jgi:LPXTG-motif cell wall-anchored protein